MANLSLADAIIEENIDQVMMHLQYGADVNQIDEYGFTPLIEAAIADNGEIAALLLNQGADVNLQDMTGGTALYWAIENHNLPLTELLLNHHANPNAYNLAGQPVFAMPLLRHQHALKNLLRKYGANLTFAQDFINAKLLGHMFELIGHVAIVSPKNQFVEVDFEGFFLEFSTALITDSLIEFKNHFAARQLRQFMPLIQVIIDIFQRAAHLIKYDHYRLNIQKYKTEINTLLSQEPLIIPVGYEGHAITFIKWNNRLIKCDRREESRLYDNIVIYKMNRPERLDLKLLQELVFSNKSSNFINVELAQLLELQPLTELKVPAQISGNCSWANVEACIPALFFLLFSEVDALKQDQGYYKTQALNFFHKWREWNKDRALHFCIERFQQADPLRKACHAEILGAILFQSSDPSKSVSQKYIQTILPVLATPEYDYVIRNYVKVYCYESKTEEGTHFLNMLRENHFSI